MALPDYVTAQVNSGGGLPDYVKQAAIQPQQAPPQALPTPAPQPEPQGFVENVGADLSGRYDKTKEMFGREMSGGTARDILNAPGAGVLAAGQVAGGVVDVATEGAKSAYKSLVPDEAQQAVSQKLNEFAQTKVGQIGLNALAKGGKVYNSFAEKYPDSAMAIEGMANMYMAAPVVKGAAAVSALPVKKAARSIVGTPSKEVVSLAKKAKDTYGIDVPLDRLAESKPLNALAASLDYVPFSGRQATEGLMYDQTKRALSKTMGQNTTNLRAAVKGAKSDLGDIFDKTLKGTKPKIDDVMLTELGEIGEAASKELGKDGLKAISNTVEDILEKGASGVMDGQAAYNIKRALDRISKRTTPEANYAKELRKSLMGSLERTLGKEEAAAFAKVREQYGNMLDIEKLAVAGAEGDISLARVGNMKKVTSPELQDIVDISKQFLRTRENPHGASQRVLGAAIAGTTGYIGGPGTVATGIGVGKATNMLLNSQKLKNAFLNTM